MPSIHVFVRDHCCGPMHDCEDGWVCEQHPERPFPHDDCAGPGVPCGERFAQAALLAQREATS